MKAFKDINTVVLVVLRVSLGWIMLHAGWTKVMNPEWTAAEFLQGAKTFSGMYAWFSQPGVIEVVNFTNEWGLALLGISLVLGVLVRLSSLLGALLMMLYYFPLLDFPHVDPRGFLIDSHIVYALILLYFAAVRAGRVYGLDAKLAKSKLYRQFNFLG